MSESFLRVGNNRFRVCRFLIVSGLEMIWTIMKVVYRGVNFFQPRMKIFSKFEISRGKGEATPKKGKLQERTSNLRMQWLLRIQGIIYALLMRNHFVSENNYLSKTRVPSICFNYSNGRYISFTITRIRSLLINRINGFVFLLRARWCITNSFSLFSMYLIFRATRAKCTQEKHVEDKIEYLRNIREINCLLAGWQSFVLFISKNRKFKFLDRTRSVIIDRCYFDPV